MNVQFTAVQVQDWLKEHKFSEAAQHKLETYTGYNMTLIDDATARDLLGPGEGARLVHLIDPTPEVFKVSKRVTGKWAYQMGFEDKSITVLVNCSSKDLPFMNLEQCSDMVGSSDGYKLFMMFNYYLYFGRDWEFSSRLTPECLECWLLRHGFPLEVVGKVKTFYSVTQLAKATLCDLRNIIDPFNSLKLHLLITRYLPKRQDALEIGGAYADIWLRWNYFNEATIYRLRTQRLSDLTRDELVRLVGLEDGSHIYDLVISKDLLTRVYQGIFTSYEPKEKKD